MYFISPYEAPSCSPLVLGVWYHPHLQAPASTRWHCEEYMSTLADGNFKFYIYTRALFKEQQILMSDPHFTCFVISVYIVVLIFKMWISDIHRDNNLKTSASSTKCGFQKCIMRRCQTFFITWPRFTQCNYIFSA